MTKTRTKSKKYQHQNQNRYKDQDHDQGKGPWTLTSGRINFGGARTAFTMASTTKQHEKNVGKMGIREKDFQ